MADTKPASPDLAAGLATVEDAAKLPDDAVDIAADDQGASALAQKIERMRNDDDA